jgi:hypothetical protein
VTASEFAFMALGLVLGVVCGAALIEVLRARPSARREVRVTVAPNSIARRRSTTLADIEPHMTASGPARAGPGDRRWLDREEPGNEPPADRTPTSDDRTGVPVGPAPAFRLASAGTDVGIAISSEPDPMMAALRASVPPGVRGLLPSGIESSIEAGQRPTSVATMSRPAALGATSERAQAPHATAQKPTDETTGATGGTGGTTGERAVKGAAPTNADSIAGACDEPKRIADERCLVATRAREGAQAAVEALRSAQRDYDEHTKKAETHAATADPRAVRLAKETAQQAFRLARSTGRSHDDIEAAARDWLTEINRINQQTREASSLAERHRFAAGELAKALERLSVEADAARISAESAEEACVAAREAVAACQEAAAVLAAGGRRAGTPTAAGRSQAPTIDEADDEETSMGSRAGEDAVIIRLLRGDREALGRLVARLGGDDEAERRRWQTSIGELLEAFVARSIEAAAFDFPTSHPFWGTFTRLQCRDIAAALASLGYRHDGFGSWADERMPTQRDLSLAVGYAGLDPMRTRHWPSEAEMRDLLSEVTVAADEYVWEAAGTLTLGELVSLLGRRADALTELWNEWGVVRPLLLAAE